MCSLMFCKVNRPVHKFRKPCIFDFLTFKSVEEIEEIAERLRLGGLIESKEPGTTIIDGLWNNRKLRDNETLH